MGQKKTKEYDPNKHDRFKALTIRQPWADKILSGQKRIEVRTWQTKYRGTLVITSSKNRKLDLNSDRDGVTICKVELTQIKRFNDLTLEEKYQTGIPEEKWKNYRGQFAWFLSNPRLVNNISVKGHLGIWNLVTDRGDLQDYQVREVPSKDYSKRNVIIVAIIVLAGLLTWIVV